MFLLAFVSYLVVAQEPTNGVLVGVRSEHNRFRTSHGAPALIWDVALATTAQTTVMQSTVGCSDLSFATYAAKPTMGVNFAWGPSMTGVNAVITWYSQHQYYQYSFANFTPRAAYFTQLVWKSSWRIGCAYRTCGSGTTAVLCMYGPPGNNQLNGGFAANVRPLSFPPTPVKPSNSPSTHQQPSNSPTHQQPPGSATLKQLSTTLTPTSPTPKQPSGFPLTPKELSTPVLTAKQLIDCTTQGPSCTGCLGNAGCWWQPTQGCSQVCATRDQTCINDLAMCANYSDSGCSASLPCATCTAISGCYWQPSIGCSTTCLTRDQPCYSAANPCSSTPSSPSTSTSTSSTSTSTSTSISAAPTAAGCAGKSSCASCLGVGCMWQPSTGCTPTCVSRLEDCFNGDPAFCVFGTDPTLSPTPSQRSVNPPTAVPSVQSSGQSTDPCASQPCPSGARCAAVSADVLQLCPQCAPYNCFLECSFDDCVTCLGTSGCYWSDGCAASCSQSGAVCIVLSSLCPASSTAAPTPPTTILTRPPVGSGFTPAPVGSTLTRMPVASPALTRAPVASIILSRAPVSTAILTPAPVPAPLLTRAPIQASVPAPVPAPLVTRAPTPAFASVPSVPPVSSVPATVMSRAPVSLPAVTRVPVSGPVVTRAPLSLPAITRAPSPAPIALSSIFTRAPVAPVSTMPPSLAPTTSDAMVYTVTVVPYAFLPDHLSLSTHDVIRFQGLGEAGVTITQTDATCTALPGGFSSSSNPSADIFEVSLSTLQLQPPTVIYWKADGYCTDQLAGSVFTYSAPISPISYATRRQATTDMVGYALVHAPSIASTAQATQCESKISCEQCAGLNVGPDPNTGSDVICVWSDRVGCASFCPNGAPVCLFAAPGCPAPLVPTAAPIPSSPSTGSVNQPSSRPPTRKPSQRPTTRPLTKRPSTLSPFRKPTSRTVSPTKRPTTSLLPISSGCNPACSASQQCAMSQGIGICLTVSSGTSNPASASTTYNPPPVDSPCQPSPCSSTQVCIVVSGDAYQCAEPQNTVGTTCTGDSDCSSFEYCQVYTAASKQKRCQAYQLPGSVCGVPQTANGVVLQCLPGINCAQPAPGLPGVCRDPLAECQATTNCLDCTRQLCFWVSGVCISRCPPGSNCAQKATDCTATGVNSCGTMKSCASCITMGCDWLGDSCGTSCAGAGLCISNIAYCDSVLVSTGSSISPPTVAAIPIGGGSVGTRCADSWTVCPLGWQCVANSQTCSTTICPQYVCTLSGAVSQCTVNSDCPSTAYCQRNWNSVIPVCKPYQPKGGVCGGSGNDQRFCGSGLTCILGQYTQSGTAYGQCSTTGGNTQCGQQSTCSACVASGCSWSSSTCSSACFLSVACATTQATCPVDTCATATTCQTCVARSPTCSWSWLGTCGATCTAGLPCLSTAGSCPASECTLTLGCGACVARGCKFVGGACRVACLPTLPCISASANCKTDPSQPCTGSSCAAGLVCVKDTSVCTSPGAACSAFLCVASNKLMKSGTCPATPTTPSASCTTPTATGQCQFDVTCAGVSKCCLNGCGSTICATPRVQCVTNTDCPRGSFCLSHICTAYSLQGNGCGGNQQCLAPLVCSSQTATCTTTTSCPCQQISSDPGCPSSPDVATCVCAQDPYCCQEQWDGVCATVALTCPSCSGGGTQQCCSPSSSPGCAVTSIQSCVCAMDNTCCQDQWDARCVTLSQTCGGCSGGSNPSTFGAFSPVATTDSASSSSLCCAEQAIAGCPDPVAQACVCQIDSYCCNTRWDIGCVGTYNQQCGGCASSMPSLPSSGLTPTGPPTPAALGDCCLPKTTGTGCSRTVIQNCVCNIDSYCCERLWDVGCVLEAVGNCNVPCGPNPSAVLLRSASGVNSLLQSLDITPSTPVLSRSLPPSVLTAMEEPLRSYVLAQTKRPTTSISVSVRSVSQITKTCCTPSATPGCLNATLSKCVCKADGWCCSHGWDSYCVSLATFSCQACRQSA